MCWFVLVVGCCGVAAGWLVWGVVGVMFFFFQAEDGIRDLVRSRGLGDVYKRQRLDHQANDEVLPGRRLLLQVIDQQVAVALAEVALSLIHI